MQTARNYVADATIHTERALSRMPLMAARVLPATHQEITRYVEQLLTPSEQQACDMATD